MPPGNVSIFPHWTKHQILSNAAASCGRPSSHGGVINGLQDGYHGSLVVEGWGMVWWGDDDRPAGQER